MESSTLVRQLEHASTTFPYPIALACRKYLDAGNTMPLKQWEILSMDILHQVLQFLTHLLLSDIVASKKTEGELYYYIQNILSRPTEGQYVGFLRESARHYRTNKIETAVPELINFLLKSEVDPILSGDQKPLLGTLVDYRNLLAHGKLSEQNIIEKNLGLVSEITGSLFEHLAFLQEYRLSTDEGFVLMGSGEPGKSLDTTKLVVQCKEFLSLRPLALKLKGHDLLLLEDFDWQGQKILFRGSKDHFTADKKAIEKPGTAREIFSELKELLQKVRSEKVVLPEPDWESYKERSSLISRGTIASYRETGKYTLESFITREEWEKQGGIFDLFLESDKSLLSITADQGRGKSSLATRLAIRSMNAGNSTLFINGQRLSYADVHWTGSPFPAYFSSLLNYQRLFDPLLFKKLAKEGKKLEPGKKLVLIIDALDEIDGTENKWNRFRGMLLLLRWVADIAQSGIKLVLTFDIRPYLDFDYLGEEDIPDSIPGISFTSGGESHSKVTWCMPLKGLEEDQAKSLFDYYQKNPDKGHAPLISWDELKAGLGDRFPELYANPLMFKTVLGALNGQHTLQAKTTEDILLSHVDQVSGAEKIKTAGFLRKLIGFLKNANISPTEQFLSDLVATVSRKGSPSFLVEDLDIQKKKEKRLKESIDSPGKNQVFKELKEAGILEEEIIDIKIKDEHIYTRRISYSEATLSGSLDAIRKKVDRLIRIRSGILLGSLSMVFIPILVSLLFMTLFMDNLSYELSEYIRVYRKVLLTVLPIIVFAFALGLTNVLPSMVYYVSDSLSIAGGNLSKAVFINSFHSAIMKHLLKYVMILMIGILLGALLLADNITYAGAMLLFAILALVSFIIFYTSLSRVVLRGSNSRMVKYSFDYFLHYLTVVKTMKQRKKRILNRTLLALAISSLAILFLLLYKPLQDTQILFNSQDYKRWLSMTVMKLFILGSSPYLIKVTIALVILMIGLQIIVSLDILTFKYTRYFTKHPMVKSAELKGFYRYLLISFFVCFLGGFSVQKYKDKKEDSDLSYIYEEGGIADELIDKDSLTKKDLRQIYRESRGLQSLDISSLQALSTFELGKFKGVKDLSLRGDQIGKTNHSNFTTLSIEDPGTSLCNFKFEAVNLLILTGEINCFPRVDEYLPLLTAILTTESVMKQTPETFNSPTANLLLSVSPGDDYLSYEESEYSISKYEHISQSRYLKLDWFTDEHAGCILANSLDIIPSSENLDKIRRLDIGNFNNNSRNYLGGLYGIEWLQISVRRNYFYTPAIWDELIRGVEQGYPNLKTLTLNGQDYTSRLDMIAALEKKKKQSQEKFEEKGLDIQVESLTEEVRARYGLSHVNAYRIISLPVSAISVRESGMELSLGDILLSRARSEQDFSYELLNMAGTEMRNQYLFRLDENGQVHRLKIKPLKKEE